MNRSELINILNNLRGRFSNQTPFGERRAEAELILDNLQSNILLILRPLEILNRQNLISESYHKMSIHYSNLNTEIQLGLFADSRELLISSATEFWNIIRNAHGRQEDDRFNIMRPRVDVVSDSEDTYSEDSHSENSTEVYSLTSVIYDNSIEDIFSNLKSPQANQWEEIKVQKEIEKFYNPFEGNEFLTIFIAGFCAWFVPTE